MEHTGNPVAAAVTATVSAGGTVGALTVVDGGSGYIGSAVTVSIARPIGAAVTFTGGVGVYTGIATATIPVVNGSLSGTANIIPSIPLIFKFSFITFLFFQLTV